MARSPKAPRRPNYDRRLARTITLKDGRRLITLKDAADLFAGVFATVTKWGTLEIAIERLMQAATTGERADVAEATDMIERVLQARRLQ